VTQNEKEGAGRSAATRARLLSRIVLALSLGAAGGAVFSFLKLPLPWLLGPMIFNTVAVMARVPVLPPIRLRPYVVVVIGVLLGSGFTPEVIGQVSGWAVSLLFLGLYLIVSGALVVPYYRYIGGFDPVTAYFAGMPGGLNEMMMIGKDMGGDDKAIILAHASRILIVVCIVAVWFRLFLGLDLGNRSGTGTGFTDIPAMDFAILTACGILGLLLGRKLRLPAPTLIGPMLLSSIVHATGLVASAPPREMVIVAQIFLGTIMGCRFIGSKPREILRALLLGFGATAIMLAVTGLFALMLYQFFGQSLEQVILAYSPGGLTEMSLVALAMHADVTYVAAHHLLRITLVILAAPVIFSVLRVTIGQVRKKGANDPDSDD
jgi:membrane AbrB-like protein